MKKRYQIAVITMAALFTSQVQGQLLGLPIATDAAPGNAGDIAVSGGIVLGDDANLYGARLSFSAMDELLIFGDLGIVDPDGGDNEPAIQVGGMYSLPSNDQIPVDLALRLAIGYANFDQRAGGVDVEIDLWTVMAGLVASKSLDDMFTAYGVLGVNYSRTEAEARAGGIRVTDNDSETDLVIGAGLLVAITEQLSLYLELTHIDDMWVGAGARFGF